jgi:ElaB/YqjD/DUF883 family membrane-anchored ribosome-binding protein
MADPKNDTKATQNKTGTETSKVSAGTSVGDIGSSPMPHAQEGAKATQSSTLASHTSKPLGGQSQDREGSSQQSQGAQGATEKAKEAARSAGDTARSTMDQAQKRAGEAYEQASDWAQDTYERASSWAGDTFSQGGDRFSHVRGRSTRALGGARTTVQDYVSENPMVVGIVGLAAGLLIGALLPRTRKEDETFGQWADEVREQGLRYAQDMTQRGREFVEESFTGDDPRFSRHEADFRSDQNANRH